MNPLERDVARRRGEEVPALDAALSLAGDAGSDEMSKDVANSLNDIAVSLGQLQGRLGSIKLPAKFKPDLRVALTGFKQARSTINDILDDAGY